MRSLRRGGLTEVVLPSIVGLVLLALGVPRTIAAWSSLEAEQASEKLQAGQAPTEFQFVAAKEGLRSAVNWAPSSRRLAALGALELSEARTLPAGDAKRQTLLAEAERNLVGALARNPSDAAAWYNLALVRIMNGASGRQVAEALLQSLHMAPNRRDLWTPRSSLLLRYWRFFDEGELHVVRTQLRTIYALSPPDRVKLLEAAVDLGEMRFAAAALGDDPLAEEAYERSKRELDRRFSPGTERPAATAPKTP